MQTHYQSTIVLWLLPWQQALPPMLNSLSRYCSLHNKGTGYEIISTSAEAATGMPLCVHCETFLWQLHPGSVFGCCRFSLATQSGKQARVFML